MAIFTVNVFYEFGEGGGISATTTDNLSAMARGDYLHMYGDFSGPGTNNIYARGFQSGVWTNTADVLLNSGQTTIKRISLSAADGANDIVLFTRTNTTGDSVAITVSVADVTPDTFNWNNVSNVEPNTAINLGSQRLLGFNRPLGVSVTNGYHLIYRGSRIIYGGSVENNDLLEIRTSEFTDYGQSKTVTVSVGSVPSKNISVAARTGPLIDQLIPLGITSGTIALKASLFNFFGGVSPSNVKLTDYYKGGNYVPTISQNSAVPTSGQIKLTDFYGSHTAYYFIIPPVGKSVEANTISAARTLTLVWDKGFSDWEIGFGAGLEATAQYTLQVSVDNNGAGTTSPTITGASGTFSTANTRITISQTMAQSTERLISGTLTIGARNVIDGTTQSISRTVDWSLIFYGP